MNEDPFYGPKELGLKEKEAAKVLRQFAPDAGEPVDVVDPAKVAALKVLFHAQVLALEQAIIESGKTDTLSVLRAVHAFFPLDKGMPPTFKGTHYIALGEAGVVLVIWCYDMSWRVIMDALNEDGPQHAGHAGDCTIYRAMINDTYTDGVCTCGYGWEQVRHGDLKHQYSAEREKAFIQGWKETLAVDNLHEHQAPTDRSCL